MSTPICEICGGPILRRVNVAYGPDNQPDGSPWFHLHVWDWVDRPHEARPTRPVTT